MQSIDQQPQCSLVFIRNVGFSLFRSRARLCIWWGSSSLCLAPQTLILNTLHGLNPVAQRSLADSLSPFPCPRQHRVQILYVHHHHQVTHLFCAEPGNQIPPLLTSFLQFKSFNIQLCSQLLQNASIFFSFFINTSSSRPSLNCFSQLIPYLSHRTHFPALPITTSPFPEPFCPPQTNSLNAGVSPACSLW